MLGVADALVDRLATSTGFDRDSTEDIQAAVHEAVVNAIVHGNGKGDTRRVKLELAVHREGLEVRIRDEGRGFDPTRVPDPLAAGNLSRSSGRGIFLMRELTDDVSFRRLAGGGTEVTLRKRLHGSVESRSASSPAGAVGPLG
ncbi:MAG TPA: ATP-binding protein [Vicinamibacteria bacterium]|nr:ATP-binding protein [Vicinamibacteria bacterium]